jgi:hypothetical protein
MKEFLKWSDIRVGKWGSNPFTWGDVAILQEIFPAGGTDGYNPYDVYRDVNKKSEEKKKKIVKLIAKIEGKEFKEEKYKDKKIKVTVKDVKILFEALNIKVNV